MGKGHLWIGWFIVGNPGNMDDDSGYPYFRTPPCADLITKKMQGLLQVYWENHRTTMEVLMGKPPINGGLQENRGTTIRDRKS